MNRHLKILWVICAIVTLASSAQATTYYVAKTGSDSNDGSVGSPWLTIGKARNTAVAGDTVKILPGVYAEQISSWPNKGTSWGNAITFVANDTNDDPIIRPTSGATGTKVLQFKASAAHYLIFQDIVIDGVNLDSDCIKGETSATHVRFLNCEIKNAVGQGVLLVSGAGNWEFINCDVHNNGFDLNFDHGFYIQTNNNLIEGCNIHNNKAVGIHIYGGGSSDSIIRNNRVYDNTASGIGLYTGSGHLVYNNLVWGNGGNELTIRYGASSCKVYNNVIHEETAATVIGIDIVTSTTANNEIKNNIIVGAKTYDIRINGGVPGTIIQNNIIGKAIQDSGTGSVISDNTVVTLANIKFTNSGANDYSLQSDSPARDIGLTLGDVPVDILGASRPSGAAYDVGAYEFVGTPTNQAPSVNAGPNQTIQLSGVMTLDGTANDDGLPDPPAASTATWSKTSGPGDVLFDDANAIDTTAMFSLAGVYVLRLTFDDSELNTYAEMTATISAENPRQVVTKTQIATMLMSGAML
jgi:parallel beta-helix repeat protein